jgi:hypothetical protein
MATRGRTSTVAHALRSVQTAPCHTLAVVAGHFNKNGAERRRRTTTAPATKAGNEFRAHVREFWKSRDPGLRFTPAKAMHQYAEVRSRRHGQRGTAHHGCKLSLPQLL